MQIQTYLKATHSKNCVKGHVNVITPADAAAATAAAAAAIVFDDDDYDTPLSERHGVVHLANTVARTNTGDSECAEYYLIPRNPCRSCRLQLKKKVRKPKYMDPEVRSKALNLACINCRTQLGAWNLATSDEDGVSAPGGAGDMEESVQMQVGEGGDKAATCHKRKQDRKGPVCCLGMGHQQPKQDRSEMPTTANAVAAVVAAAAAAADAGGSSDEDQDLPLNDRRRLLLKSALAAATSADDHTRGMEAEDVGAKRINTTPMAEAGRRKKAKPNFVSGSFFIPQNLSTSGSSSPAPASAQEISEYELISRKPCSLCRQKITKNVTNMKYQDPNVRDKANLNCPHCKGHQICGWDLVALDDPEDGGEPRGPEFVCPHCDRDFSSLPQKCRQVESTFELCFLLPLAPAFMHCNDLRYVLCVPGKETWRFMSWHVLRRRDKRRMKRQRRDHVTQILTARRCTSPG